MQPLCGNCPLFLREDESQPLGECHGHPQAVAAQRPVSALAIQGQPQQMQIQFIGGFPLMNASAPGCPLHPVIAEHLVDLRAQVRSARLRGERKANRR